MTESGDQGSLGLARRATQKTGRGFRNSYRTGPARGQDRHSEAIPTQLSPVWPSIPRVTEKGLIPAQLHEKALPRTLLRWRSLTFVPREHEGDPASDQTGPDDLPASAQQSTADRASEKLPCAIPTNSMSKKSAQRPLCRLSDAAPSRGSDTDQATCALPEAAPRRQARSCSAKSPASRRRKASSRAGGSVRSTDVNTAGRNG